MKSSKQCSQVIPQKNLQISQTKTDTYFIWLTVLHLVAAYKFQVQ